MDLLIYIIKVNIALIIFYVLYSCFFRSDTFLIGRRIILLLILFISFIYPFVRVTDESNVLKDIPINDIPAYSISKVVKAKKVSLSNGNEDKIITEKNIYSMLGSIYLIIVCLLFTGFVIQILSICRKINRAKSVKLFERKIYKSVGLEIPFSFFKWIVLDPGRYSNTELKEIILHEQTHSRQWHSIDTLLCELVCVFCWFNPSVWLIKKELRLNLEFLADYGAINSGCEIEHYQLHLVKLSANKINMKLSCNFHLSPLKKRISMMNRQKTAMISTYKYLLFIPFIYFFICFNTKAENLMGVTDSGIMVASYHVVRDEWIKKVKKESVKIIDSDFGSVYSKVISSVDLIDEEQKIMEWIATHLRYPEEAIRKKIQGRVMIRFIILQDGSISGAEILRSVDPILDQEALYVIRSMPNRKPLLQDGKPTTVYYTLPLLFELPEKENSYEG